MVFGKCAANLHGPTPIPLTDRPKSRYRRTPPETKKLGVGQWIKCVPPKRRFRQPAITSVDVQANRPKFMMMWLAHLQLSHPVENFAWVEIAENASVELEEKWRVNRITQIEQCVWST